MTPPKKEGDFSLGEAQRQIEDLWDSFTSMQNDLAAVKGEIVEHKHLLIQIDGRVAETNRILQDYVMGAGIPRCVERGIFITTLQTEVREIKEGQKTGSSCAHKARLEALEKTVERIWAIIKWFAVSIGSGVLAVAGKALYLAATKLPG